MPIYEYACRQCGTAFERRLKYDERLNPQTCPECGRADASLRISAPALVGGAAGGDTSSGMGVCPTSGQPCGCGLGGHRH
jgi:putative FmdB family regulatory protein